MHKKSHINAILKSVRKSVLCADLHLMTGGMGSCVNVTLACNEISTL